MNINQKVIRLLDQIINGRKGYCGDHFVYTPQLEENAVNELRAELISENASQPAVEADAAKQSQYCSLCNSKPCTCGKIEWKRTA